MVACDLSLDTGFLITLVLVLITQVLVSTMTKYIPEREKKRSRMYKRLLGQPLPPKIASFPPTQTAMGTFSHQGAPVPGGQAEWPPNKHMLLLLPRNVLIPIAARTTLPCLWAPKGPGFSSQILDKTFPSFLWIIKKEPVFHRG